jgi:ATP sulfurylase
MTKSGVLNVVLGSLLILGGVALAQRPKEDIDPARHPNMAAAQRFTRQAWDKMVAAQTANEFDLGGHAQKAKEALDVADREMKLAAVASNHR